MAKTDVADTVRMRVRGAIGIQTSGTGSSDTTGCGRIVCAVGEIDQGDTFESVVWIRGGSKHNAIQIDQEAYSDTNVLTVELPTLCAKPNTLSDEVALLADDVAAAIHTAKIVESQKLENLAVLTTSRTSSTAYSFVKVLRKIYDQTGEPRPTVSIVFMDSVPTDAPNSSSETTSRVFFHEDVLLKDSLRLDGCLDLCCSDASIEVATRHVEPLGTLMLLPPTAQDTGSAIAIDMNAVVVNELVLLNIGDYSKELPHALEFLAEQSAF